MSDVKEDQLAAPAPVGVPFASARKLAMGAVASGTVSVVKIGLQLLLLPVMARLLGPDEFGIYALALPTISFVTLLADGGMGATLAREPETSSLVWSSAFWFLLFTGLVLAMAASAFGLGLSYVVHQPRIAPMIAMLSLSLVLLVLSVPAGARLTRRRNLHRRRRGRALGECRGSHRSGHHGAAGGRSLEPGGTVPLRLLYSRGHPECQGVHHAGFRVQHELDPSPYGVGRNADWYTIM